MKIEDEFRDTFKDVGIGTLFNAKEIETLVRTKHGRTEGSILPSAYCYNRWSEGISKDSRMCLFEYLEPPQDGKQYKYLGENYPYSGEVYHYPKGGTKRSIGKCVNGVYYEYKTESNNDSENNNIWDPPLSEYDPQISVEQWIELWNDEEVFNDDYKNFMNEMMLLGGQATCAQLAERFLGDRKRFNYYNLRFVNLGKRVQLKTNKPLLKRENDNGKKYWSIICYSRELDRKTEKDVAGQYVFKLREELQEALGILGLPDKAKDLGTEQEPCKVKMPKNLILYGPPGTGKTYNTVNHAVSIVENKTVEAVRAENRKEVLVRFNQYRQDGLIEFCTFHQSFGYEEFIEGIKPETKAGNVTYDVKDGIFKDFCKQEATDLLRNRVFIIDEINRGNISKIFGELITLIEESKRIGAEEEMRTRLPYSGEKFGVPGNVYLLGTMNTADRSIALLDTALRRRFKFEEMQPQPELLAGINVEGVNLEALLDVMNRRIEVLYDREHTIGHSFFMGLNNASTIEDLAEVFECSVIPLLKEYFYNDYPRIAAVLGDDLNKNDEALNFISLRDNSYDKLKNVELDLAPAYKFNRAALRNPAAYQKIYE